MSKSLNHEKNSPTLLPYYSQDPIKHIMSQLVFHFVHRIGSYFWDISKYVVYFYRSEMNQGNEK